LTPGSLGFVARTITIEKADRLHSEGIIGARDTITRTRFANSAGREATCIGRD